MWKRGTSVTPVLFLVRAGHSSDNPNKSDSKLCHCGSYVFKSSYYSTGEDHLNRFYTSGWVQKANSDLTPKCLAWGTFLTRPIIYSTVEKSNAISHLFSFLSKQPFKYKFFIVQSWNKAGNKWTTNFKVPCVYTLSCCCSFPSFQEIFKAKTYKDRSSARLVASSASHDPTIQSQVLYTQIWTGIVTTVLWEHQQHFSFLCFLFLVKAFSQLHVLSDLALSCPLTVEVQAAIYLHLIHTYLMDPSQPATWYIHDL